METLFDDANQVQRRQELEDFMKQLESKKFDDGRTMVNFPEQYKYLLEAEEAEKVSHV